MSEELRQIEFVLNDNINGQKLTLTNVDLPTLRRFLQDVEELVEGENRRKTWAESRVLVETGSVKITPFLLASVASKLISDLSKVGRSGDLDLIPSRRAKVIERWQETTRESPERQYSVTALDDKLILEVQKGSRFYYQSAKSWLKTKKYLMGTIVDAGGIHSPNVHFVQSNGVYHTTQASQTQILSIKGNPIYKKFTLYVEGEQHLLSKDLRNLKLIELMIPARKADPEVMERFWSAGEQSWSDIDSPSDWVEEQTAKPRQISLFLN